MELIDFENQHKIKQPSGGRYCGNLRGRRILTFSGGENAEQRRA